MNERKPSVWSTIGASMAFFFLYSLSVLLGFALMSLIYRATGEPPKLAAHLLSAVAGVLLLTIVTTVLRFIPMNRHRRNVHMAQNSIFVALDQISKGNFDVLLDPRSLGNFHELADAVNEMARNLGTLETMREDFISNVSHEIQSPLTSIGGFAKLMKDENLPPEQRKHYAEIIESESKRLSSLGEKLLKLSSLDQASLNKTEFRLDKQLEQIALTFEPQWSAKNITLEADLQRCAVTADQDLLSQVWINLLHNAIKFTPDGGMITIVLNGNTVVITDTGIGISEEDQIHIFERFYKVDRARDRSLGGNGLGLSLVKKIVELHGGEITVHSAPGRGTAFTVLLLPK